MRTLLRFTAGGSDYALSVEQTLGVQPAAGLSALPDMLDDVAGVLVDADGPFPVMELLTADGPLVIVIQAGAERIGLLADEVAGVVRVDAALISPAPAGQRADLVRGLVGGAGEGALLLDVDALASRVGR
jgi:chemotaxis signal transduction protein